MTQFLSRAFHQKTLRAKLTLMTMAVCAITAFMLSSAFIINDINNISERQRTELSLLGKIMGKRSISRITFDQPSKAAEDLEALSFIPAIMNACIYVQGKGLFASYISPEATTSCPDSAPIEQKMSWHEMIVHQPIDSRNTAIVSSIYLLSDLRMIYQRLERSLITMLLIVSGVMVLSYFIAAKLQKIISRPIMSLVSTTRSVGMEADYSARATKYDEDEIGELTDSFNDMMRQIQDVNESLERKVRERTKALEAEKIRAESSNRAKSEFLRNMSHEFRTPLHAMNSFSIYGIKEAQSAERDALQRYFDRIQTGTNRLLRLVDGILSLARLESGQETFKFVHRDLRQTLQSVENEQQSLLQDKDITLTVEPANFSTTMVFDHDKMMQVFTNIVSNAIKFTDNGKTITISFEESQIQRPNQKPPCDAVTVHVSDQGVGIPKEELSFIFDKFVQSSRTNTGAGGTGLGLAIVRSIMAAHEGFIRAANNDQGGAVFSVTIPRDLQEGQRIITILETKVEGEIAHAASHI